MIKTYKIINDMAEIIDKAGKIVVEKLKNGVIKQEPDMTSQLLSTIETLMGEYEKKGIVIKASVLTDRGPNSEESKYGADFIGTLTTKLQLFSVEKGFLAQAKLFKDKTKTIPQKDFKDMVEQCKKMLNITPFSYLIIYSKSGIKVLPAHIVVNTKYELMKKLLDIENNFYMENLKDFYKNHFECFIGDLNFDTINIDQKLRSKDDENKKLNRLDISIIDANTFPEYLL